MQLWSVLTELALSAGTTNGKRGMSSGWDYRVV